MSAVQVAARPASTALPAAQGTGVPPVGNVNDTATRPVGNLCAHRFPALRPGCSVCSVSGTYARIGSRHRVTTVRVDERWAR